MVTSHAAAVPTANVTAATPADSSSVRDSEPGSTVETRCGQMLSAGVSASSSTVAMGSATTDTMTATIAVHAGETRCRCRQAAMADGRLRTPVSASVNRGVIGSGLARTSAAAPLA